MSLMDYFKPLSAWTAEEVRDFIDGKRIGEYNLVDVRQPGEYEMAHLPGAKLIPLGELPDRLGELDVWKTTIVYCAAGVRSRAAASTLEQAGFRKAVSMMGGINAWHGLVAKGFPEAGTALFDGARSLGELTALAWLLEGGTKTFYEKMAEDLAGHEASVLFRDLVTAEASHGEMLSVLYRDMTGTAGEIDFPALLGTAPPERIMEGGMGLDDAFAWSKDKTPKEILEFCISLEAGSYDRYVAMQERAADGNSRKIFSALAGEEKRHLGRFATSFEKLI